MTDQTTLLPAGLEIHEKQKEAIKAKKARPDSARGDREFNIKQNNAK